jgi:dCMP deaminase
VQGAHLYSTLRPCFGCLKEAYQAGVSSVRYLNDWAPTDPGEAEAYEELLAEAARHGLTVEPLDLPETLLDLR